jgi:hypothetical protein
MEKKAFKIIMLYFGILICQSLQADDTTQPSYFQSLKSTTSTALKNAQSYLSGVKKPGTTSKLSQLQLKDANTRLADIGTALKSNKTFRTDLLSRIQRYGTEIKAPNLSTAELYGKVTNLTAAIECLVSTEQSIEDLETVYNDLSSYTTPAKQ